MLKFILLAVLVLTVTSRLSQNTPIPTTPDGYARGSETPELHIEAYYDLLCPGSQSQWNILEPVLRNTFNITNNQTLRFTIHLFPLPYHIHSFTVSQGAKIIAANQKKASDIFDYLDLIFRVQTSFETDFTFNKTQQQIKNSLNGYTTAEFPYVSNYFLSDLASGNQYDSDTRVSWKYGLSNRVTGTPTFFANGVAIDGGYTFTADDWTKFINGGYIDYLGRVMAKKLKLIKS